MAIHIPTTIGVLMIFIVAVEQACSISVRSSIFKVRVGVMISNAVLLIWAIALNIELLREEGRIHFVDGSFVLVVRTLQMLYMLIVFLIAYYFVTYSIQSAYKSSLALHWRRSNESRKRAPKWMSKLWLCCTVIAEIVLFGCYVLAFALSDVVFFHFAVLVACAMALMGCALVIFALFDIRKQTRRQTERVSMESADSAVTVQADKLRKLRRLLVTMIVMAFIIMACAIINLYIVGRHIYELYDSGCLLGQREGTLTSSAIDNTGDYLSLFAILMCIGMGLVFWTYKPSAVNYCAYCCRYRHFADKQQHPALEDMKLTLCYALCPLMLDEAERKRRMLIRALPQIEATAGHFTHRRDTAQSTGPMLDKKENDQEIVRDGRQSVFSMAISVTKMLSVTNDRKLVDTLTESGSIQVIFYDFDGALTTDKNQYFAHWSAKDVSALQRPHLFDLFGSEERMDALRDHFGRMTGKGIRMGLVSDVYTRHKMKIILSLLDYDRFFSEIMGIDHDLITNEPTNHNRVQIFLIKWMRAHSVANSSVLYVTANEENCRLFANNGTCNTYLPGSASSHKTSSLTTSCGITSLDVEVIEQAT